MKRFAALVLALSLLDPLLPPFLPLSWGNVEAVSWEPEPWPGLDAERTEEPASLAPQMVPGLVAQRIHNTNTNIDARFLTVSGSKELNDSTLKLIWEAVSLQEEASGVNYMPQAHARGAGLNDRGCQEGETTRSQKEIRTADGTSVVCDIVFARGAILGQRLRVLQIVDGSVTKDHAVTLYTDTEENKNYLASEIWQESAYSYVWDSLLEVLKRDEGALSLSLTTGTPDVEVLQNVLENTVIGEDNELIVTFAAGTKTPELASLGIEEIDDSVSISLPESSVANLLTDFGHTLLDTAANDVPLGLANFTWPGNAYVDCKLLPCLAMTYDDGPSQLTPGILDAYAEYEGSATFFVLGSLVESHSDVLLRAHEEGHVIANHSWSHEDLTSLKPERVASEINQTNTAVFDVIGVVPNSFRPPYGAVNEKVLEIAKMPAILWDVDTNDWQKPAEGELINRVVDDAKVGSIVLQHDIHQNTANTVWEVLEILRGRGFTLVNVEQLFGGEVPQSGLYRRAD